MLVKLLFRFITEADGSENHHSIDITAHNF